MNRCHSNPANWNSWTRHLLQRYKVFAAQYTGDGVSIYNSFDLTQDKWRLTDGQYSLTWNDVDFENGRLIISDRESTTTMPPFHIKDHEARRVPLPAHTIDLLTQFHAKAPEGVPYILLSEERYKRVKSKWQERFQIQSILILPRYLPVSA